MALDSTIPVNPPYILQYGIPVTVFVADQKLRTEVWRAPDSLFPIVTGMLSQSGLSSYVAGNVTNGNYTDTAWHTDSAVPGAYLQVDLGASGAQGFLRCNIYALAAGYAGSYDIEYADNGGGPWTAASTGFIPSAVGINARTWGSAGPHRYWRIRLTNTPGSGPWLTELEFLISTQAAGTYVDSLAVLATTIQPAAEGGVTFIDPLPNDGAIRYYKSRHIDEAGNGSGFTPYTEGLTPVLISGAGAPNPMAAFGAIVDQLPPNSKYEIRFAGNYADPDSIDGMQSYIDFPASTNFLRLGTPPQALVSSTNATPINVQVTNHGYATGDRVIIRGHLTNTNANGPWTITVVDAHNFTLNGSTGNGVGIGTGRVTRLTLTVSGVTGALTMYGDLTVGALTVGYGSQLLSVVDTQASPVTRTKLGKVGVATTDYGIQVFDQNAATIMDFTGAKRILAVPVQASVDSGSACTLDLSTGLTQQVRVTAASWTLVLNNPTNGGRYRLWMQQDSVAGRPWPNKITDGAGNEIVMYTNDTPPVLSVDAATAGEMALYEFEYRVSPTKRFTCVTLQKNVLLPTPQVQSVTPTAITTSGTNHNVSMPATVNLGDLLITIVVTNNQGVSLPPTGWTRITSNGRSTTVVAVDAKVANGTEGGTTVNWTTDFSCVMAAHVYRITKWYGSVSGVAAATDQNTSTTPDPPAATPGWAVDRGLWIATAGIATAPSVTSTPANYTNRTDTAALSACTLTSARRSFYASTENPGTFTISASNVWCAMTIAIRPPS